MTFVQALARATDRSLSPLVRRISGPCGARAALAALATVATWLTVVAPAGAWVVPCRSEDGRQFPSRSSEVGVVFTRVDATPDAQVGAYWVVAETLIRNQSRNPVTTCLLVADEAGQTDRTTIWLRGQKVEAPVATLGYDPALPDLHPEHARRLEVTLAPGELAPVRVMRSVALTVDALGQRFLSLPTHLLAAFDGKVEAASIAIWSAERMVALRASLSGESQYDEPSAGVNWYVKDWEPRAPLSIGWLSPWQALVLVAAVEKCPDPLALSQAVGRGHRAVAELLAPYDAASRAFCATLPSMLHGAPLSASLAAAAARMTANRYVASAPEVSLYRPNPAYAATSLTQLEGIYARLVAGE